MRRNRRRARVRKTVVVRTPEDQTPFLFLPGAFGGVFMNLLWNWGDQLEVPMDRLAQLLSSAKLGSIVIARRMTTTELNRFRGARRDADRETDAFLIPNDDVRWEPPRRR